MAKRRETVAERTGRLLDEYVAKQDAKRAALGPAREMAPFYLFEVSAADARRARTLLSAQDGYEKAFLHLRSTAISRRKWTRLGDYESIGALLGRLGGPRDISLHLWTPARTSRLCASLDALQRTHGSEAKLARALDEEIAFHWWGTAGDNQSVVPGPLRSLKSILRRAVARKNALAMAQDLSML